MPSWQQQIKEAAVAAATEAVQVERGRCLWLLDCMMKAADEAIRNKLLPESVQHIATVKLSIVQAIIGQARRGIISGLRPPIPLNILRQPTNDLGEMQTRCSDLIDVLLELGWEGAATLNDVKKQIKTWNEQEDLIDELRDKMECMEHDGAEKQVD